MIELLIVGAFAGLLIAGTWAARWRIQDAADAAYLEGYIAGSAQLPRCPGCGRATGSGAHR